MRKNILRILSFTLTAMVMITSVPMTGFASQPIKNDVVVNTGSEDMIVYMAENSDEDISQDIDVANSEGSNNVTDSESVSSNETNITDSNSVSSNETNITDSESVSMNETNVVQSLLDASYVIEGGDYTYEDGMENDSDFKELFTAVYNDKCFEERGGRFYTGEQIVSLKGKKGANVKAIKKSTGNEVSLQEVTDSAEFAVTGIPAEFSDAYSWRHNSDGRYNYTDNNLFLDTADDLKNRKLFAWEYEKGSDGIYRRVSVQEIKQYSLDGYIEEQTTVSGKVVVDISKLKNKTNPIAIIAFMYDAGKDSDWNSLENWFHYDDDYQDAEDGQWKYYSRVFATVKYIEKESKRYALYFGDGYEGNGVKKYYNDEIYSKDLMGTFSMAPYIYLRDDEKNTVTIFGISPAKDDSEYSSIQGRISLGNYKEFRYADDLSDYVMDDWSIPAKWTDQTTSKTYDVRLATAQYGTKYPSMTGTLTLEEGVGFPEDCSDLFHLNGPMEGIVIGGKTGTVGSNITNMSGMFWGNEINNNAEKPGNLLGRLDIKAFDTSNVTNMSRMFYGQRLGEPLDVSTLNTSKVTDFSYMFYQLYAGNPDVSNFDTSSAVDMSYMFGGVGYSGSKVSHNAPAVAHGTFTELNVSGFDFSKVKSMRGMFSNNAGLTKIVLPKEPKTGVVEDMSELFMSCSSLSDGSIENLEKLDTSGCTDMAVMFGCDAHTKLIETRMNDKGEVIRETEHKFGNSLSRGPAFTKLDLSNFNTSKVKDMSGMFDLPNCKTIIFGDGFDVSGVELMQGMFTLNIMDELDISSFNTASLMNASAMFNMPVVRKLTLGKFDLSHIESVYSSSRMFGCKTLDELDLSEAIFGSNKYALCSDSIAYNNEGSIESGSLSLKCIRLPANLPEFISQPDLPAV
ncbi:MAG: DUF285 domain-containing protein, partial [Lachnospiraceae bacterium]|nr:DUF285 domain-containing protein [Lachnospiraceae bacterium]